MTTYIPSTYNINYDMTAIFPLVDDTTGPDILVNPGKRVLNLDFLDQGLQNILNSITQWRVINWNGVKWTSVCFQYQGTTSAWLINLAFNGLTSPLQLQYGMQIRIPDISQINSAIAKQKSTIPSSNVISIGPPNIIGGF